MSGTRDETKKLRSGVQKVDKLRNQEPVANDDTVTLIKNQIPIRAEMAIIIPAK
jgi:hypothetical protein